MFEIAVDPIYPPKKKYPLSQKNFELIYSPEVNTRRPFDTPLYPVREPEKVSSGSRVGVRSRRRKSRTNIKRNFSVAHSKNKSIPNSSDSRSKKALSNIRKHTSNKSAAKNLERAYLSTDSKTKSPGMKKGNSVLQIGRAHV